MDTNDSPRKTDVKTNKKGLSGNRPAALTRGTLGSHRRPEPPDLTQKQDYTLHRATSKDQTGANWDARTVTPGASLTVMDADGPGMVSHIWFTINDGEPYHLKRIVLRIYWDNETTPSVEAPIGDFFGLGTGEYEMYQSEMLSVGGQKVLNCFFPMPYAKHARITVTNEGKFPISSLYYNIEYREDHKPLPPHTLYFHAQYRQANPNRGWTGEFYQNGDPLVVYKRNDPAPTTTSGSRLRARASTSASPCRCCRIRTAGGAKATTCSSSMEPPPHPSPGPARRTTSWAPGTSARHLPDME